MTWRLLGNLIRHLPPESATKTALRNNMSPAEMELASKGADPARGPWSHMEMLVAAQSDTLRWILHILLLSNGGKSQKPEPTPRPGVSPKRPKLSAAQAQARADAVWQRINGGTISGAWQHTEPGKVTHLPRGS